MKSIKTKLVLGILLILSLFVAGILTYSMTFKDYFQKEKLMEMSDVIKYLDEEITKENINKIDGLVNNTAERYNVQIEIAEGSSGGIICSTYRNTRGNMMMGNGMSGMNRLETVEDLGISDGVERSIIHDKSSGVDFLTSEKIDDEYGYKISVRIPINIMDDAVSKSLRLLTIIFIPITIIVLIITIIFSNLFTRPIIEIKRKTSRIRKLDFNDDLIIKGCDEISGLAASVNSLSHKIESTLNDLNEKNRQLEKMIDKERKNEIIRKEFVSSVSHELKSPIAVISGYAQALKGGIIKSKDDIDYYISVIDEEADRMQVIVSDLLDLYKLESNTFKLEFEEVHIEKLIRKIIKKNKLKFDDSNVNLQSKVDTAVIMADEVRLEQAIQNYINNALSHIDENKVLQITATVEDGYIRVAVYNSGENIREENIEKIWKGFVREDKVRNYKEKRVGLGLAVVKQIVKLHDGRCGVVNRDSGVEFWIEIKIIRQ